MTDHELENFEKQLRRIQPAKLPEELSPRLLETQPAENVRSKPSANLSPVLEFFWKQWRLLRWVVPASAAVVGAVVVWRGGWVSAPQTTQTDTLALSTAAAPTGLNADDVKIDQQLMSSFDAVTRLPGGEPVRFRCENWMDQVVLSDKTQGLIVENRTPRLEVVAVAYETY